MTLWQLYKSSIFLSHQTLSMSINFAIISGQNPAGHTENPLYNQLLDKKLQARLQQLGVPYRSVIGAAPDLSFQEKSWVVLCDKQQAITLALEFTQNAIYWVEQGQLYLVPVLLHEQEECLGQFQQRLILLPA
jgi:hypothetical protein